MKTTSLYDRIRISLINGTVIGSLILVIITELLSYFKLLRFDTVFISWLLVLAGAYVFVWRYRSSNFIKDLYRAYKELTKWQRIGTLSLFILLLISFIIGIVYPVNNYDSQTYHMARVAHWEQNHSVYNYATHVLRQLELSPFAEWVILHLQILTGGDRLASSVQLFFLMGCVAATSMIAKKCGANSSQQFIVALMTGFIPMAVLQSNTTQNDLVVSFFILAFVYYSLSIAGKTHWSLIFLSGFSLGLAWLTKGSGFIFTSVFCIWYFFFAIKEYKAGARIVLGRAGAYILIPVIALLVNSGFFYRNILLTGSPLGKEGSGTAIEAYEIKPLILVAVKNIMGHTPVTRPVKDKVSEIAIKMGVDPDDTRYSLTPLNGMVEGFNFHDDYAQNFFHLILTFVSLVLFFSVRKKYPFRLNNYNTYVVSLLMISVLYTLLLKWQPWGNRLMTPLFMMYAVLIGIEIGRKKIGVQFVSVVPVMVYGFVALLWSTRHPILPLTHSIFSSKNKYNDFVYDEGFDQLKPYLDKKPYKKIGIIIGKDNWDYIYYKLLRVDGNNKRLIEHVFVNNYSSEYSDKTFVPDAIISLSGSTQQYELGGKVYNQTGFYGKCVLFEPK